MRLHIPAAFAILYANAEGGQSMKEYEIVCKYLNGCAGEAYPQITFEEAELNDPADYIRAKHGHEFEKFTREELPDGKILYGYMGKVCYFYEFNEL